MRAHFYRPVQDSAGNTLPNVQVSLYNPGTLDLISETIWADGTSSNVLSNPFITSNGLIDVYTDNPMRVTIGIVNGNQPANYLNDQDILAAGSDSPHIGAGSNSTQVGVNGSSTGSNSVSYGYDAQSAGNSGTALGASASATANQSTAVGAGAQGNGVGSTVVGNATQASGASSTALGDSASAEAFTHSTAIGADATNSDDNQIVLGTDTDTVLVPGTLVLKDSTGGQWQITVDATGTLTTTAL